VAVHDVSGAAVHEHLLDPADLAEDPRQRGLLGLRVETPVGGVGQELVGRLLTRADDAVGPGDRRRAHGRAFRTERRLGVRSVSSRPHALHHGASRASDGRTHARIATTNGATPVTTRPRDTRTALDAYMAHHASALALLARITEALANHDDAQVEDPDHQSIDCPPDHRRRP
jgi:hypothetical protein